MDLHDMDMTISDAVALLQWQIHMGADEAINNETIDRYDIVQQLQAQRTAQYQAAIQQHSPHKQNSTRTQRQQSAPTTMPLGTAEAIEAAHKAIAQCHNLEALDKAILNFDGLKTLKQGASHTVIGDGNPNADILLIGEAPDREDDRTGHAFSGPNGSLLNNMFKAINLTREDFFAAYMVFWRPAGGHSPNEGQINSCLPFLQKRIDLMQPKLIITLGSKPSQCLFKKTNAISRLRGNWIDYQPIMRSSASDMPQSSEASPQVTALFSPEYLRKNPAQKKLTWQDLQHIRHFLSSETNKR